MTKDIVTRRIIAGRAWCAAALAVVMFAAALSPAFAQDVNSADEKNQAEAKKLTQGHWTLSVEKTTEMLKAAGQEDALRMLPAFKGMSLNLKEDGTFEMAVPARDKITGKWSVKLEAPKNSAGDEADSDKAKGRITLDPDNLGDDHEDMHFDFVFQASDLIKLTTPINPVPLMFSRQDKPTKGNQ